MSYAQAEKVAQLATYYNAVAAAAAATYLKEVAFLAYLKDGELHEGGCVAEAAGSPAGGGTTGRCTARRRPSLRLRRLPYRRRHPLRLRLRPQSSSDATSTDTADWACIRDHESGGNYSRGNGGAYQFELGTWRR